MFRYERLMDLHRDIKFREVSFLPAKLDGLLHGRTIYLRNELEPHEKNAILGEEIGHYYTIDSRITDYTDMYQYKNEIRGRRAGYEINVPIKSFVECFEMGLNNVHEVAEHLELPDDYVWDVLKYYEVKHENKLIYEDYRITFNPLIIEKNINYKER